MPEGPTLPGQDEVDDGDVVDDVEVGVDVGVVLDSLAGFESALDDPPPSRDPPSDDELVRADDPRLSVL